MPFYTTFSIYPKIYDCSHPPISIIFSNEKLNTSTVPFISYLMPKIVPKTDYDKCQISGSIELHCVGSLGVYASPRAKAVSPYKSKNHRQIHIYTKVQNTKMQDRIPNKKTDWKNTWDFILGCWPSSSRSTESRIQNTTIQALQKAQRTRGIEFLSFIEFF